MSGLRRSVLVVKTLLGQYAQQIQHKRNNEELKETKFSFDKFPTVN